MWAATPRVAALLGMSGARIALRTSGQRTIGALAFQAAEAALLDAQLDLEQGPDTPRGEFAMAAPLRLRLAAGRPASCVSVRWPGRGRAAWYGIDFADGTAANGHTAAYGQFTGQAMQAATAPCSLPRYLIESFADRRAGAAADLAAATAALPHQRNGLRHAGQALACCCRRGTAAAGRPSTAPLPAGHAAGRRHGAPAMPACKLASAADMARAGAVLAVVTDSAGTLYQAAHGGRRWTGRLTRRSAMRQAASDRRATLWQMPPPLLDARDPGTRQLFTAQQDGTRLRNHSARMAGAGSGAACAAGGRRHRRRGMQRLSYYLRGERAMEVGRGRGRVRGVQPAGRHGGRCAAVRPAGTGGDDMRRAAFQERGQPPPGNASQAGNDGMLHVRRCGTARRAVRLPAAGAAAILAGACPRPPMPRSYADGGIAAAAVRAAPQDALVGALGSAAQGLFGLDISEPSRFGQGGGVLFEFTDRDDPDIGNIFSAIARFRTGAATQGDFVVVALGYNNNRADGEKRSSTAGPGVRPAVAGPGRPEPWQLDGNYFKFT